MTPKSLVPAALLLIALGFGLSGNDAFAADASSTPQGNSATNYGEGTDGSSESLRKDLAPSGQDNLYAEEGNDLPDVENPGEYLYVQGCSTCHGLKGEGTVLSDDVRAPKLIGVGDASVDFYVSTGRMPINQPKVQAPRKTPMYNRAQIDELIKYIRTFSPEGAPRGADIPELHPEEGDLTEGAALFANNCAQCHNSQGSGGALGRNFNAPNLYDATPVQVAEAIRIGPGAMPIYGPNTFDKEELNSLVNYVGTLKSDQDIGGFGIGGLGPVAEGFVAWLVGLGALLAITRWIGTRI